MKYVQEYEIWINLVFLSAVCLNNKFVKSGVFECDFNVIIMWTNKVNLKYTHEYEIWIILMCFCQLITARIIGELKSVWSVIRMWINNVDMNVHVTQQQQNKPVNQCCKSLLQWAVHEKD